VGKMRKTSPPGQGEYMEWSSLTCVKEGFPWVTSGLCREGNIPVDSVMFSLMEGEYDSRSHWRGFGGIKSLHRQIVKTTALSLLFKRVQF